MKILILTPYITKEESSKFSKNKTGFGYMVYDIAKSLSQNNIVHISQYSSLNGEQTDNNILIHSNKIFKILRYFKIRYILSALKFIINKKVPLKEVIRIIYYFLTLGVFEKNLDNNYDLVHIHGCTVLSLDYIKILKRRKVPFMFTLHGLIHDTLSHEYLKNCEIEFLNIASKNKYTVSFVSSGILDYVYKELSIDKNSNFKVVLNGTNTKGEHNIIDIRYKYNINKEDHVILSIGNLSERKNQLQLIEAYLNLEKQLRSKIKILFLGGTNSNYAKRMSDFISKESLDKNIFICGYVSKEEIASYYYYSNSTCMVSVSEGFGLSIIEGFQFSLPNLCFSDLSVVKDIYNENVMYCVKNRTNEELAMGIDFITSYKWDLNFIKNYSNKFSLEIMADSYESIFKTLLKQDYVQ